MASADFDPRELTNARITRPLTLAQQLQTVFDRPLMPMIGLAAIFLAALLNLVDIEGDNQTVSISGQVLLKLAVLAVGGLFGAFGFLHDPAVRKTILTFPVFWIVIIFGFYCLSIPGSVTPIESMASTISIACILLMTVTALVQSGTKAVLTTVFHALGAFVALSWVAVLAFPEIGIFLEPLPEGEFASRFAGLAHPNTLGQFSGLTIVIGLLLFSKLEQRSFWRIGVILMAGGTLIGSLSRTSMLATLVAVVFVYREQIFQKKYRGYWIWLGLIGTLGLIIIAGSTDLGEIIASKLPFLSKSGEAEELSSATGRSDIWAYAIKLIGEQPLTGYGAATSKYYLMDYSLYTHNLILNVAFSTGVLGGLMAVWMCLGRLVALFTQHHPVADALVAFILVNGMFENVIFSILAGLPTIVWTIALCLPVLPGGQRDAEEPSPSGPTNRVDSVAQGRAP